MDAVFEAHRDVGVVNFSLGPVSLLSIQKIGEKSSGGNVPFLPSLLAARLDQRTKADALAEDALP